MILIYIGAAALAIFALRPAWSQFRLGQQLAQLTSIIEEIVEAQLGQHLGGATGVESMSIANQANDTTGYAPLTRSLRAHPRHVITRELLKNGVLAERMGRPIRVAAIETLLGVLIDEGVAMNMDDFAKSYM